MNEHIPEPDDCMTAAEEEAEAEREQRVYDRVKALKEDYTAIHEALMNEGSNCAAMIAGAIAEYSKETRWIFGYRRDIQQQCLAIEISNILDEELRARAVAEELEENPRITDHELQRADRERDQ